MSIASKQAEIVAQYQALPDWESRYKKIIEQGKALGNLPESLKIEDNKVRGCQSQVWMSAKLCGDRVEILADSDAAIVKGLVALLVMVYSNEKPSDILQSPPTFLNDLGLNSNLSQSRVSGLSSMVKQIMFYAMAFQSMLSHK